MTYYTYLVGVKIKYHTRFEANKGCSSVDDAGGGVENRLITVLEGRVNTKETICRRFLREITVCKQRLAQQ